MNRIFEIAAGLTQVPGVSGEEERSFPYLKETFGHLFDEVGVTPVSSFYGVRHSKKPNAPTILMDAHLDTIGFVVTECCDGGFLKVLPVGGISEKILPASEVWIHGKETIQGVFASKPPHLQEPGEAEKPMRMSDLSIDTGLNCKKEKLEKIIRIGTYVSFKSSCERMNGQCAVSPYFDDRICAASILRALELVEGEELGANIAFQFSSREETGIAGARTTAYHLNPDFGFVLDVCHAYTEGCDESRKCCYMGKGCVISYAPQTTRTFTEAVHTLAVKEKIPIQLMGESGHTGTNSNAIQTARGGIPVCLISVPLKNMHTANEIVDLRDARAAADLLAAFLRKLPYLGKEED